MFLFLPVFIVVVFILNGIVPITCTSYNCSGSPSLCPNGEFIEYPFYWENPDSEYYCGYPGLSAKCSEGGRPILILSNHSYYYLSKSRASGRTDIHLWDTNIADQICPKPRHNFSLEGVIASSLVIVNFAKNLTYFYNCTTLPEDVAPNLPCIDYNNNNASSGRSFALRDSFFLKRFNWYGNCEESVTLPLYPLAEESNYTQAIKSGILLRLQPNEDCRNCEISGGRCSYSRKSNTFYCDCGGMLFDKVCPYSSKGNVATLTSEFCQSCKISGGRCSYNKNSNSSGSNCDGVTFDKICPHSYEGRPNHDVKIKLLLGLFAGIGGLLLILLLVYRRRCLETGPTNEEVFLKSYGSHVLQTYKYSDIKKITNSFKDILGQGGFGYVYKGKLLNGRMVAVKLLNESKGDGEEFINEVATIGRTNHVNVVTLIGFCIEGTKRALVYEFMVNGSLEKFIYKEKSLTNVYAPALGWEKLYQIALGIARGLEYLHRGCNNRILHFDIKPHNILLDSEFVPKISDFGLAKLSQTRDSVVSVVGARGTSGYIAPEIHCRNFGVVSYKSDVYSYGMMLFEMISGRKNIDTTVENPSGVYFPHWIYNHLDKEKERKRLEDTQIDVCKDTFQDEIAKKMIMVALWCIQAHPTDRPSMTMVVEMFEATNDKLQMPPNPFLHSSSDISPLLS